MFNLSLEDKRMLRGILPEYNIPVPKYLTQEKLNSIDWTLFKEYNVTIMELLQKRKEENQNNYLAIILTKELAKEEPQERYVCKWNTNITLVID